MLIRLNYKYEIVCNNKIGLFLKYTDDTPITPLNNDDNPDGTNDSVRGFLLTEFVFSRLLPIFFVPPTAAEKTIYSEDYYLN